ncbi:MAG: MOSC N-terminal beta barrel domain-containing protein [Steroidobacteraceae bacterium]
MITLASIHCYPVKGCRGLSLGSARLTPAGLEHDREWLVTDPGGRAITQRDSPGLARIDAVVEGAALVLSSDGAGAVHVPLDAGGPRSRVRVWDDDCGAIDQGDEAAHWLGERLGREVRLVRFDPDVRRPSDPAWAGDAHAPNRYSDGFPLLVVSLASLADLNSRLEVPVPMERFRPNLVLDGLEPFGEDALGDFGAGPLRLRVVKPCTRCVVTTTDQRTGERLGEEPVRALRTFRWDAALRGVTFGQNTVVIEGAGSTLEVGQSFERLG